MTHMKTGYGKKRFIRGVTRVSRGRRLNKVYRAVERAIGYKHYKKRH